ncbi:MAG TPA: carboxypeptidase-like regulatory domain-containing protein [Acidobacteriaceae bacterium]
MNSSMRFLKEGLWVALFALCLGVLPLQAQQYLGNITGNVSDPTGAKIADAQVTATNATTKFVTKSVTNASGGYSIPFLNPGTYTLTITAPGFQTESRTDVTLTAGANQQADFSLQVGGASDKVIVTADAELLDTGSANLGTTLGTKEVTDLPNIGRNPFVLSTLAAGVTTGAYMQSQASGFTNPFSGTAVQIISNGSSGHNRLTLDGIPDDPAERLSGASYTGFVPSPEAVQEVKTQTALYDAQYGHGNGTVLNTVLRSGSNQYHGSAYYVFRNTYLNANRHERVPTQNAAVNPTHRVNDQWSQPGFVIDGPLSIPHVYNGHDKTFFMAAYERVQLHQPVPFSGLVPTAAQVAGDFSGLCSNFVAGVCAPGAGVQLYDPLTADSSGNRTPFLNNNIASRINPAGAALASYYPTPNSTLSPTVNYISSDTSS